MTTQARALSILLVRLAEQLEALPDDVVAGVVNGNMRLRLAVEGSRREKSLGKRGPRDRAPVDEDALKRVEDVLKSTPTREEGLAFLTSACQTKAQLLRLAQHLDLHVLKDDDAEKVREKIIDDTIGFRLRSNAVRGTTGSRNDPERGR